MESKIDTQEVYRIAREAVRNLAEDIGKDALFTFDQIWDYASSPVPPRQKSSAQAPLRKEGFIEPTGGTMKSVSESRAGSPASQYRFGPKIKPHELKPELPGGSLVDAFQNMEKAFAGQGLLVGAGELANFYLAMCVSPLVVLSGISGTGKSRMPRQFAQFTKSRFDSVPVKPQWSDNADLFGYAPSLKPEAFVKGRFTEAIEQAKAEPQRLALVLLDEMNLAAVEHYFSDFLSVMETRRREGDAVVTDALPLELPPAPAGAPDPQAGLRALGLPANVRVVGTANMDETTHLFSPKVLDRAFSIESAPPDLTLFPSAEAQDYDAAAFAPLVSRLLDPANPLTEGEAYATAPDLLNEIGLLLQEANDLLRPAGISFGYRTRRDVCLYMYFWQKFGLADVLSASAAMDLCFLQKVLPKVQGAGEGLGEALHKLYDWLTGDDESKSIAFSRPWPRSADKVQRMLARLESEGATTYWGT